MWLGKLRRKATGQSNGRHYPTDDQDHRRSTELSYCRALGDLRRQLRAQLAEVLALAGGERLEVLRDEMCIRDRQELATKIAESSANASRLTDELVRLDGRARELVEQKLGVEADRLAASEQQLRDLERDAAELEIARKDHAWFVAALRDFAKVWVNMSPENQGRFLRALIDKVVVDEDKGTCRVELIDFDAASGTKEAA